MKVELPSRITVPIIFLVLSNFAYGVWYVAQKDSQDFRQDERITKLETWQDGTRVQLSQITLQLAHIDEKLVAQNEILQDMKKEFKR